MKNTFDEKFGIFFSLAQEKTGIDGKSKLSFIKGRKYVKVVQDIGMNKSVFCFVEIETGNILKANSWLIPHKTPRGSIHDEDHGMKAITKYGAIYLK